MVVLNIATSGCAPQTIVIGRRGTFETMQIVFDLTYLIENYGDGTAVLALKRSQDSSAYPAVETQEDNTLTWVVSEVDTYYVGAGECQLMWYVDGGLAKTIIYPMVVMRDILSTSEEAPDAYQEWVDDLTALGAETLQNARDAAQSATDAETAQGGAEDAQLHAETAQREAEAAADRAEEAITHQPIITNGYWWVWNEAAQEYQDTGVKAEGRDGTDGFSPTITVVDITGGHRVTITDVNGTRTVDVMNGTDGTDGDDGYSPVVTVTNITGGHRVTITDKTHPSGQTFDVMDGVIQSVNGKSAASITLDSGDIEFDDSETYQSGSTGAKLSALNNAISALEDVAGVHVTTEDFISGHYINANGTLTSDSRFSATNMIRIPEGATVIDVQAWQEVGTALSCAFYSGADFTTQYFISGVASAVSPTTVDIPQNAVYVAFSLRNSYMTFDATVVGSLQSQLNYDVADIKTSLVKRNQWNLKSLDIRKGFTSAAAIRADSFTIRLDISGGQTIHCYAGITTDTTDRRTLAFNSAGTRLDYYNGFVERDINLPANTAYILMTADWNNRDKVYIRDASNNYLFRYDKSIEYPASHNYKTIRVASWNVGGWDSEYNWVDGQAVKTSHTGAELKELLKTLFTELNADIITLNEYVDTFDGVNIYNDVLKHFYPYYYTWAQETGSIVSRVGVFSRFPLYLISYSTTDQAVSNYVGGYIMLDFETQIGFTGIHLSPSSAAERITQANAVANMYNSYNMALFCGDMNTGNNGESDADIQAQITPFTDNGYEPSNRGYWGDIPTYYQPQIALDNIYVKGGIINKFAVVEDRPGSDHNPIVSDVTFFA